MCQPFFENAGTRPKRNIAKITRSKIWKVQLKSGDNCINEFDVSRFHIERTTKLMFIRLIDFFSIFKFVHICN
jgi:hypothetical protein